MGNSGVDQSVELVLSLDLVIQQLVGDIDDMNDALFFEFFLKEVGITSLRKVLILVEEANLNVDEMKSTHGTLNS